MRSDLHSRRLSVAGAVTIIVLGAVSTAAWARPGGGGGGGRAAAGGAHRSAPTSVHRGAQGGGAHMNAGGGANRANVGNRTNAASVNRGGGNRVNTGNTNINSGNSYNRNVNVNVDADRGWDNDGWNHHPVAAGVAFGTAAAVTSAVIGSMVYSLPPSCRTVMYSGVSYSQCGSTWYAPQYAGTSVTYVVVNQPY